MSYYQDVYSSLDVRPKEEPTSMSFASRGYFEIHEMDDSSAPGSTMTPLHSNSPTEHSPYSRDSGSEPLEDEKEPASGPERSQSVSSTSGKSDKEKVEKRKRSRVTPDQLVHLERFFLLDRSPTAARRREISELLGMQERQTQIWFQNRRAKAKLQDGKQKGRGESVEVPPPDSPPQLSTGFQVDLYNLIHEDEPVTIIPCTDLTIGTWRRIATTVAKHDLVAYVCDAKRCITWFIHSVGFGFKMEIPFETIIDTEFTNAAPGSGLASFLLSEPPIFYLENIGPPSADGTPIRHWKRCADWTEGQQASRVLRHDLIGSAVQLAHLLRNLQTNSTSDIPLRPPSYRSEQSTSPIAAMELPLPPMANLTGPGYHYQHHDAVESPVPHQTSRFQKRSSYTGSGITTHSPDSAYSNESDRPPPYSAPSSVPVSFAQHQSHSHAYSATVNSRAQVENFDIERGPIYGEYSSVDSERPVTHRNQPVDEYSDIAISHGLAPRPYSAHSTPRSYYSDVPPLRLIQPYPTEEFRLRRSSAPSSAGSLSAQQQHINQAHHYIHQTSPSPPLLTTPYHPPPHLLN
ncbi:hypothetical protein H0H81_001617 [Sphagnurus paluster]|uniref:Homeobox domain-containing protein n=1 Tax=Sphagnurus paluster TaxID=117069 RepID=A0A9P7KKJ9_9AGAR|nr:hypothetical protein H0H81_001617 [Sphagnurus paluster]